jgi:hypothetical protein
MSDAFSYGVTQRLNARIRSLNANFATVLANRFTRHRSNRSQQRSIE